MFNLLLTFPALCRLPGKQGEQKPDRPPQGSDWRQGHKGEGAGGDPKYHHQYDAGDQEEENRMSPIECDGSVSGQYIMCSPCVPSRNGICSCPKPGPVVVQEAFQIVRLFI